ncbi:hypothetical protein QZH41_011852, partial [Actinostola sp. cb2023]
YSTKDSDSKGTLVLGHISMIMDMKILMFKYCSLSQVLTRDNKYIITAERDEKIRVSHFPNSHSIESYCLGHTDFVSSIKVLPHTDMLVSGGGDGSVILWDFKAGKKLFVEKLGGNIEDKGNEKSAEDVSESEVVSCIACCRKNSNICVMIENSCTLHLYHVDSSGQVTPLPHIHLSTSAPPWNITFDCDGLLWCLLPKPEEPVAVFRREDTSEARKFVKVESFKDLSIYEEASDWSYLEECLNKEPHLSLLRKRTDVDNMKEYLTRKEERIQQKKARLAELQTKEAKRDVKRIKV